MAAPLPQARMRRSKGELRELVLASGRGILRSQGLGTGVERLTFKKVLDHLQETEGIRITQASLIRRVWTNQEEFQRDVVESIIRDESEREISSVGDSLSGTFARIDLSSPEMRRASLAELIRASTEDYLSLTDSPLSTIQTALIACALAGGDAGTDDEFLAIIGRATERLTHFYVELYESALEFIGFRVRPGMRIEQMAITILSLGEGSLLRRSTNPDVFDPIVLPRELDGMDVDWDLFGFGVKAIVEAFVEEDPDWSIPGESLIPSL